ncbi:MAG: tRNA epoxyqueuosine(34) reductase QueG [Bryobacteraceae bacterium]|nr:tRNA epoxyqueuosine(34) reductase QueG [Bryobacteraceae bacterium]
MLLERLAGECKLDLVGAVRAGEVAEYGFYADWVGRGKASGMKYLTDHRGELRQDVRRLLPSARTVIVGAVLYNSREANSTEVSNSVSNSAWISRYAWGDDYHEVLRERLEAMAGRLAAGREGFEYRVCVDTAPVMERALARRAGLGWIGKNTCLINERQGSWFFLGEILVSASLEELGVEEGSPPPDRCGTCTACIEACPTEAIVPVEGAHGWEIDSGRCISYQTIESREAELPAELAIAPHVFGCDICQDVCPWNRRAPVTLDPPFQPREGLFAPRLETLEAMTEEEWRAKFKGSPVKRAKWAGWRRNLRAAGR